MIKIENVNVYGWEPAIRGMRDIEVERKNGEQTSLL